MLHVHGHMLAQIQTETPQGSRRCSLLFSVAPLSRALNCSSAQVGKSSIIKSYISNNFDDSTAAVIPVAVLPPEASPEGVPLTLVDTSSKDDEVLEDEIRKADVAVVVYAADRPDTLARVISHWLPRLRDLHADMPVVVAGNKLDLRSGDAHAIESELRSAAGPIMQIFRQVETLIDCSAKKMVNVSELMLFATKAVLHPTAPLYDTSTHELKLACVRALTRIFALSDGNQDGVLDDTELNKFQREVFGSPLVAAQITGIKNLIRRNVHEGITDAGITVSGFLYLHKLFIQRGRSETTWEVGCLWYMGGWVFAGHGRLGVW
jgi:Ras family protein T1